MQQDSHPGETRGGLAVRVAGEDLTLLPERAIYWERESTVLIADPHWGKAAAFRAAGLAVSEATTRDGLARLERIVRRLNPSRIIYLGDYLHAAEGRGAATFSLLQSWGEKHHLIEQILVRGNHDRSAGDPPAELRVHCIHGPLLVPPFSLRHYPAANADEYVLAGHLHPAIRLFGPGRQRERFPCFWFQNRCAVLPSFGAFTGFADVQPVAGDRVFAIAADRVLEISG
ncbi:ligase-associated DNA damage response endonuclease PdeM [soil metagenome]